MREIAEGLQTYVLAVFRVVGELEALGYIRRSKRGGNKRRILGLTPEGERFLKEEEAIYG